MAPSVATEWQNFAAYLEAKGALQKLNELFKTDAQILAFTNTTALVSPVSFQVNSSAVSSTPLAIKISNDGTTASVGPVEHSAFTLSAQPDQWEAFFKSTPTPPFHTYWGIRLANAMLGTESVAGDLDEFARFAHIWRRVLELLREVLCGSVQPEPMAAPNAPSEPDEPVADDIIGRYVELTTTDWGRCRVFYEQNGAGGQDLVFLHTAGSDGRQLHAVMNSPALRQRCTMYVFDMPGHGRSLLGSKCVPGSYKATEDDFIGILAAFIRARKLDKPIICGASLAGNLCLAAAIRNHEVHAGGVIPLQACEYIFAPRGSWDRSPSVNASLFNPESVYGTMSPTAPTYNKNLMWQTYSGQGHGILASDLEFYFGGWDGRGRVETIDTRSCPVYMLTGEDDWVNPPALSQATAGKIPGATFKSMPGLGHFPIAEKPDVFVPFLVEAIEHIQRTLAASS